MNDDWFDFLSAMLGASARFLVVGAHAIAAHGIPRGTQDLDVWGDPEPVNDERVELPARHIVVPFLGRAALVATKRASARPKDLPDLHALGER